MKRTITLAVAVLLVFAAVAFAQRGPAPQGGPGGPGGIPGIGPDSNALADYLGLTSEQIANWQTSQNELRTSVQALHEQQRTLADSLRTALEGSDAAAIGNLMLQLKSINAQIDAARDAAVAKFKATLSSEQQTRFDAMLAAADYLRQRGPH